jgi:hypothetical protein
LTLAPEEAVRLLGKHLKPVPGKALEKELVQRRITELGSDSFEVREKAAKALRDAGRNVRQALIEALRACQDLEKRHRLERLLRGINIGPVPEMLRPMRALEVLGRLDTPEANRLLRALAKGNRDGRLTMEATATLKRLERRR